MKMTIRIAAAVFTAGLALQATASNAADLGCNGPCYEQGSTPAYERTWTRRVEIAPGEYEIAREPSLYGWVTRSVVVDKGGDWTGRISYKDGGQYAEPTYHTEKRRVLLRPYKNIAIYHRAQHEYVKEHVVIEPETTDSVPAAYQSWKDY